ncbi:DUF465 domain-containing protein [Novosphingobium sp. BL-52-GroH]|uniref:DUF465 domain-containing protein n=1 Tax=Novosphingobium sp. BL-52-GroH TaxID=3349877 RepID=UPI00384EEE2D
MTDRMFRLLERLQKLDALINGAKTNRLADPLEIAWLRKRKLELRARLAALLTPQQPALTSL